MSNELKLSLSAEETSKGTVSGKGSISFKLNLTDLSFSIDYRQENKLVLNLAATQGFRISTKGNLTFSGDIGHDLLNRTWDGGVKVQLTINKKVSAALQHSFSPSKKSIKFDLKFDI
jgi:hypothetical protein